MVQRSIFRLIGYARAQITAFVHEEVSLLKTELGEKFERFRQGAISTGIGATIGYAGLLVVLTGLGFLLSLVCQNLGLGLMAARAIGFGIVGLCIVVTGGLIALKAVKTMSKNSVAPEKTIGTIRRIGGTTPGPERLKKPAEPRRSATDLQKDVLATEQHLGRTLESLAAKVSPTRHLRRVAGKVRAHPVRWNLGALATGFASSLWFVKRMRK